MTIIKLSSILFILCFTTVSGCNIFIYFLPLAIPRMGTLFVYIQLFVLDQYTKKRENIFILMSFVHLCSSFYFHNRGSNTMWD